jgi:hypothetical protein
MSFILKESPVVVNIKLTNEGRKKLASGNFNVTKFSLGDSEINYNYYNEINFNKNSSIVLSPKESIKDIRYKIKRYYNSDDLLYHIFPLSSKRETKININTGFFNGTELYELAANTNFIYAKINKLKIDISDINNSNLRNLRIRQKDDFIFTIEPEIGDYILVNWSNQYNNSDNFNDGIIDYDAYSPFIWYKIVSITGSILGDNLIVEVDRDLPYFGNPAGSTYFSNCLIYPKYNSMLEYYGTENLSDFWNFTDDNYIENTYPNIFTTRVLNLTYIYPSNNVGFSENNDNPNNLQGYQYTGFLSFISEYDKDKNQIYGIVHYTNTTPQNLIGESFYKNTAELLLPTIMWHRNKDNKLGLRLICDNILKRVVDHNIYYYDLTDEDGFIVGKCFYELKIFLIEDQELLTALSFKSNRNWTLPKGNILIADNPCDPSSFPQNFTTKDVLFNATDGNIYLYKPSTNSITFSYNHLEETSNWIPFDIAASNDKVWIYDTFDLYEYNLNLNPISLTYNRLISRPSGFSLFGAGLEYLSENKLIYGSISNGDIYELDITNSPFTHTNIFNLPTGTRVTGDILYQKETNSFIISYNSENVSGEEYIAEFDINGNIIKGPIQYPIVEYGDFIYGLYRYNNNIFAVSGNKKIYRIDFSSLSLIYISQVPIAGVFTEIYGASQYSDD